MSPTDETHGLEPRLRGRITCDKALLRRHNRRNTESKPRISVHSDPFPVAPKRRGGIGSRKAALAIAQCCAAALFDLAIPGFLVDLVGAISPQSVKCAFTISSNDSPNRCSQEEVRALGA